MIKIEGLYNTKEELTFQLGRYLTKEESYKLDVLLENEIFNIDNITIKRILNSIANFEININE